MCEGAFILIQGVCGCSVRVFPGLSAGVVTHYLLYRAITHLPLWDMGPICGCSCLSLFRVVCTPGSLVPPSLSPTSTITLHTTLSRNPVGL